MLVAYAGVIILFARSFMMSSSTLAGDLIVALSAILLGERIVYIAKIVQRVDPVRLMLYQSIIGSAGFFLIGFAVEADQSTRWTAARGPDGRPRQNGGEVGNNQHGHDCAYGRATLHAAAGVF